MSAVTRRNSAAAVVVRIQRPDFEAMVTGRLNAQAALLRGLLTVDGDIAALMMFQRCLPGPPGSDGPGRADHFPDRHGAAEAIMSSGLVQILEGNTFVVSDDRGDIEASLTDPTGLFSFDTRFLSRWVLTINGQRLDALSTDDLQYFQTRFFLVPGGGTVYVDAKLSVIRQREVADGFHEELRILNHESKPVSLTVRIDAASDFADLFEVKDALKKKGQLRPPGRGRQPRAEVPRARPMPARPGSHRRRGPASTSTAWRLR